MFQEVWLNIKTCYTGEKLHKAFLHICCLSIFCIFIRLPFIISFCFQSNQSFSKISHTVRHYYRKLFKLKNSSLQKIETTRWWFQRPRYKFEGIHIINLLCPSFYAIAVLLNTTGFKIFFDLADLTKRDRAYLCNLWTNIRY